MRRRVRPQPLSERDIEVIRLIARCYTNQQIADHFGIRYNTFRAQLHRIHHQIGTDTDSGQDDGSLMSRVRMVAWAFENGLMNDVPAAVAAATVAVEEPAAVPDPPAPAAPEPPPGPTIPAPLVAAVLEVCEAIVTDRPRGDLRKLAAETLRAAGRLRRPNPQRAKPAPPA